MAEIWSKQALHEYARTAKYQGQEILVGYGGNPALQESVAVFNLIWLLWPEGMDACLHWTGDPMYMPMDNPILALIEESLEIEVKGETVRYWAENLTAIEFITKTKGIDLPYKELVPEIAFEEYWVQRAYYKFEGYITPKKVKKTKEMIKEPLVVEPKNKGKGKLIHANFGSRTYH